MTDLILTAYATARDAAAKARRATEDAERAALAADAALVGSLSAELPGYHVGPDDGGAIVSLSGDRWGVSVHAGPSDYSAFCGYSRVAGPCATIAEIAAGVRAYLDFQPPEIVRAAR